LWPNGCVCINRGPYLLCPNSSIDQDATWYRDTPRHGTLCLLWPNGWLDQDATWYEGRPRPRPHCAGGPSSPLTGKKRGHSSPLILGPCLCWPNGWMDQDANWYGGKPWSRSHCVRWEPTSPPRKGAQKPPFLPMSIVAKLSPISATDELLFMFLQVHHIELY